MIYHELLYKIEMLKIEVDRTRRLINTPMFEVLYSELSEHEKTKIAEKVRTLKIDELRQYIHEQIQGELDSKNIRQLRIIASDLGIKYYGDMKRTQLLGAIVNARKSKRTT